ncbi:MAG: 4-hydroxy-tetrahydrodipicolinate synthase [Candidatus Methanomethylicota archaeon]|uniref:4-hydroxy-tetrahydrodipicolinate synthase n=1 Tax=Thermoproteota archaeon TaxID=2056631 RepID=A0A497F0J7_9CREN|nr:MAG: 4-hydroxy-tetrahydrodipicolinate synthase [Candidatus Verstraetearchaeota archaeon]
MLNLSGIFVPHVTPFKLDESIDFDALKICINYWIESGLSGLVTLGSNGEFPYLTKEEKIKLIQFVLDEVNGKIPVIVGTGAPSTKETLQLSKEAADLGADALIIVQPYYYKISEKELISHYSEILKSIDVPIILYNIPKFTGYNMGVKVVEKLVNEFSNIVGIKDSSNNIHQVSELIRTVGNKISVLAGNADMIFTTLMLGGKGAIVAVANFIPEILVKLYSAFSRGDYDVARRMQMIVNEATSILNQYNQIAAVKAFVNLRGMPGGIPRKPILPLKGDELLPLKEFLKKLKLL